MLLVENGVRLLFSNGVLAGRVARVDHGDATEGTALGLLLLLLRFLYSERLEVLVHLEEAVVLLVDNHVVLQHVLVVGHAHHSHGQLFTRERSELAPEQLLGSLVAERDAALLVRRLLQQM